MLGSFFATIPGDLLEAARIDGAGWFDVFRRIALPLAVPGIVSFAIIDFVFVWNDLLLALTLLGRDHQRSPSGSPISSRRTWRRTTWWPRDRSWRSCPRSCCSSP